MRAQLLLSSARFGRQVLRIPRGPPSSMRLTCRHWPQGRQCEVRHVCAVCTTHVSSAVHMAIGSLTFGWVRQLPGPHQIFVHTGRPCIHWQELHLSIQELRSTYVFVPNEQETVGWCRTPMTSSHCLPLLLGGQRHLYDPTPSMHVLP